MGEVRKRTSVWVRDRAYYFALGTAALRKTWRLDHSMLYELQWILLRHYTGTRRLNWNTHIACILAVRRGSAVLG